MIFIYFAVEMFVRHVAGVAGVFGAVFLCLLSHSLSAEVDYVVSDCCTMVSLAEPREADLVQSVLPHSFLAETDYVVSNCRTMVSRIESGEVDLIQFLLRVVQERDHSLLPPLFPALRFAKANLLHCRPDWTMLACQAEAEVTADNLHLSLSRLPQTVRAKKPFSDANPFQLLLETNNHSLQRTVERLWNLATQ